MLPKETNVYIWYGIIRRWKCSGSSLYTCSYICADVVRFFPRRMRLLLVMNNDDIWCVYSIWRYRQLLSIDRAVIMQLYVNIQQWWMVWRSLSRDMKLRAIFLTLDKGFIGDYYILTGYYDMIRFCFFS